METQIALVSAQPMPTLILAFQRRPGKIILLTSNEMKERAEWLKEVLSPKGVKTKIVPVSAYDISDIRRKVTESIASEEDVTLNVTGGTKIMALGAFLEASGYGLPVFYVDTAYGVIRDLKENKIEPIDGKIRIKEYLKAHGFQMTISKKLQEILPRKKAVGILEKVLIQTPRLTSSWNSLFSRNNIQVYTDEGIESVNPGIQEAFKQLADVGIGRFGNNRFFCDEDTRDYLLGGWLEDYVYHQVNDLKPDDLAMNVEVEWETKESGNTFNEFDVLFTKNFRLFYISCKTSLMSGEHGQSKSALYELDALRDRIAGLFGKAMLVTMRELRKADFFRAKRMGIAVVQGKDIGGLRPILAKWMQGEKGK